MYVLSPNNEIFNIDLVSNHSKESIYYGVLEFLHDTQGYTWSYDKKEKRLKKSLENILSIDYFFKKLESFQKYEYPLVTLSIKNYKVQLPLNWKILVCYPEHREAELLPIEELLNFKSQAVLFNPFESTIINNFEIKIENILDNKIPCFVPKLEKNNLLVLPLGNKSQWNSKELKTLKTNEKKTIYYPDCIFVSDETEKFNEIFSMNLLY